MKKATKNTLVGIVTLALCFALGVMIGGLLKEYRDRNVFKVPPPANNDQTIHLELKLTEPIEVRHDLKWDGSLRQFKENGSEQKSAGNEKR